MGLTPEQHEVLLRPLNKTRVAKRSQGGKQLSYLEAWDVKAHLTRIFGFCNWDSEMVEYHEVGTREYQSGEKDMVEVIYSCRIQLSVRDQYGYHLCKHTEAAVGSASGPATMLGDHHDNALKTAASDALKRCAINLGTQFGLSLYDDGQTADVVKKTLVEPAQYPAADKANAEIAEPAAEPTAEQVAILEKTLGATPIEEPADVNA